MNRILKLVLVFVLTGTVFAVWGQEENITRSTDVIVLQGKSYYLHTVQPGQTLFSICRAYAVSVADVKALNKKKEETLRLYEVLRIPYVEPFVQQDDKYYYHKVRQGETLYSIARLYEIKPKRLLKFNEEYQDTPLAIGNIVKLPLSEIVLPKKQIRTEELFMEEKPVIKDSSDIKSFLQEGTIAIGETVEEVVGDTLPESARKVEEILSVLPTKIVEDSVIRVALLLPFSANAYPVYQDSMDREEVKLSSRSEMFLSFYEGMLLAVDSIKSCGYQIELYVYDTERSSEKAYVLADELNRIQPNLIIGPVYASVYKVLAEQLNNKNIPLIYPLSARREQFGVYPNFVQVNASLELVAENMLQWLDQQCQTANVLYLDVKGTSDPEALTHVRFKERLLAMDGVRSFIWNMDEVPLDSLRVLFLPDRENIIMLPEEKEGEISKVLPLLSALTDRYQLTILGFPEWQTFASIDHQTFYKLNTKLFTYSYVDYSLETIKQVTENYRKYFSTEPNTLVFKAFDMGLYFMKLVAKYGEHALEALEHESSIIGCSQFRFRTIPDHVGKENNGFYIIHYTSDYRLKITTFNE